jgi:AdoMet-dependent rRNA methyltransferase SPB1
MCRPRFEWLLSYSPGGWLQVAQKYMPKPSLIIGLDLDKIKPIPGVITHVEDITSSSCRITLKKDLKTWKADVFLHDGAPNVGVSWIQDAFTQNELVLSACKLATEFLLPGGTFVTKVFRSKDYNKLMWVFNQLFGKVEATKPTASRSVSAEIFVVCREYLAPKKIDPRLLDPKYAFKEMDDGEVQEELDPKKLKSAQGQALNDLMHPEKRKRHREGYEDGDYTLHTTSSVIEFIKSIDFLGILSRSNTLSFEKGADSEEDQEMVKKILSSSLTNDEIKYYVTDLKVLGKKDFKQIIKWRDSMRLLLGLRLKKDLNAPEPSENKKEEEVDIDVLIEREREAASSKQKKLKKKQRERKQKVLLKLRLGMEAPLDIGVEAQGSLESLPEFDMGDDDDIEDEPVPKKRNTQVENDSDEDSDILDSDEEVIKKVYRLDSQLDSLYDEFEKRRLERNPSAKVKKVKESSAAFEEWYGIQGDEATEGNAALAEFSDSDESSSDEDTDQLDVPAAQRVEEETALSRKARLFFDNPIFDSIAKAQEEKMLFDDELVMQHKPDKKDKVPNGDKKKKKGNSLDDDEDQKGFEVVPVSEFAPVESGELDSDDDGGTQEKLKLGLIDSAQAYTLAQRMTTKSGKRDLIDESFNRFAFNDPDGLPTWFA